MKKVVLTAVALGMFAQVAFADEAKPVKKTECNAPFPFSLFEEKADGTNCPPNAAEKAAGDLMFGAVVFTLGAEAISGGEVFPLNSGILSGL